MSNKLYEETDVQAIANAIRSKNGSSNTYKVSEMAQAVLDIPTGSTPTGTKEVTIDTSGTTTENVSAYANVEITVPQGQYKPNIDATPTNPSITVSNGGLITAEVPTQYVNDLLKESFTEGYIESSDVSMKVKIGGSATRQMNTVNGQTVTPSQSQQNIAVQGDFVLGAINVAPIPSEYVIPTGTKQITDNGTGIDVSEYASVDVNVSGGGGVTADGIADGTGLTGAITLDTATSIKEYAFRQFTGITSIHAKNVTALSNYFPPITIQMFVSEKQTSGNFNMLAGCSQLTIADVNHGTFSNGWFTNCTNLKTLILRKSSVTTLASLNPFSGTPFASGGTGGTVYVPSALISSYQTATNWSTLYNGGTCTFVAIEGSAYENYYADGTPIT